MASDIRDATAERRCGTNELLEAGNDEEMPEYDNDGTKHEEEEEDDDDDE